MGVPFNQACEQLRLSGASRNLYATDGMPEHVADRLAIEAGQFPYTVWPEMADHIIDTAAGLPDFDWDKARHERRIQEGRTERQRARRAVEREMAS